MAAFSAKKGLHRTRLNLFIDIGLALAFVLVLEEKFTGLQIHELLGIGLGVGLLTHLILHWRWIVSVTRTFFRQILHGSRFNYLLNALLFIDLLIIIVTGIGISRTLGLSLGLARDLTSTFERLHILASSFSLILVGLHVAIHWKWIATHGQKYLLQAPLHLLSRRYAVSAPTNPIDSVQQPSGGQS